MNRVKWSSLPTNNDLTWYGFNDSSKLVVLMARQGSQCLCCETAVNNRLNLLWRRKRVRGRSYWIVMYYMLHTNGVYLFTLVLCALYRWRMLVPDSQQSGLLSIWHDLSWGSSQTKPAQHTVSGGSRHISDVVSADISHRELSQFSPVHQRRKWHLYDTCVRQSPLL